MLETKVFQDTIRMIIAARRIALASEVFTKILILIGLEIYPMNLHEGLPWLEMKARLSSI